MRSGHERTHARERGLACSCTKPWRDGIATTPTNHPERGDLAAYMREHEAVRARAPVISEKIVS